MENFIYFFSLILCMALGSSYKAIDDIELKKSYGAGLGILIVCLVCRQHFYHSFIMVIGNSIIIKCCDKRYLHQLSLVFTWLYLIYLNYELNVSNYVIWIHQGMALRLVGLAFEVYLSEKIKTERNSSISCQKSTDDILASVPTTMEVLTYSYFFVGIHKGPYYKMKVFNDYFELPFSTLGDFRMVTVDKLKKMAIFVLAYLVLSSKFPSQIYTWPDFYKRSSSEYRFLYNLPQLVLYFLQHQIIMTLCTCVFTETGLGVYPSKWQNLPGLGPSARSSQIKLVQPRPLSNISLVPQEQEYNFTIIKCFDNERLLVGPMMKDSVRGWDMPTQNWFWAYVYKSLLRSDKDVRSACSFFIWSLWCGPTLSQLILSITIWIYVHLETEYNDIFNTSNGSMKLAWDIGYSIMRLLCLVYLTPCLILNDAKSISRYYNSIFWSFHWLLFFLLVAAYIAYKIR